MRVSLQLLTTIVSILEQSTDIQHHFLRDHAIKGDIIISHVRTNEQLDDNQAFR
jgi:hypothetical protein